MPGTVRPPVDAEKLEDTPFQLVVHPVRKRTRGRSGIFAWQGGGRRRADARQGRQRNHAEIPPEIWFVFWPDVPLVDNSNYFRIDRRGNFWYTQISNKCQGLVWYDK